MARFRHTYPTRAFNSGQVDELFTADVKCNGTVIKLPKTQTAILSSKLKFLLNGSDLSLQCRRYFRAERYIVNGFSMPPSWMLDR